jgi:LysM repeat protein
MSQKQRGLLMVALMLIGAILLSACEIPLSTPPAATPTVIPTGLFVSPFPSVENPMEMIEEFARQTAAAQTAAVSGGTPGAPSTLTTGTVLTPQTGGTPTPPSGTPSTPTNVVVQCTPPPACPAGQTLTCPAGGNCPGGCGVVCAPNTATYTPITPGARPASYTLQKGEWPWCIARRLNLNPDELLALNGLTNGQIFMPGLTLKIPQTGNPFPGPRTLQTHPATFTVSSSDETIYGVACKYGDVDPAAIAQANGISVSSALTVGQQLKIP